MRVLPSVGMKSVTDILERLTILHVCREALDAGIKIGSVPKDVKDCRVIVKQILNKLRPEISCIVRNYSTKETGRHRLVIGNKQYSLCPWAVQVQPIGMVPGVVPLSSAIRRAIPTRSAGDVMFRAIGGTIGAFCKSHGFTLSYRVANNVDDLILLATLDDAAKKEKDTVMAMTRLLRENLISPLAFCRAVVMVYDSVKAYKELAKERKDFEDTVYEELAAKVKKTKEKPKIVESDPSDVEAIFKGNEEERQKNFLDAIAAIGGTGG